MAELERLLKAEDKSQKVTASRMIALQLAQMTAAVGPNAAPVR
jgi:hypothetical protein